MNQERTHSEIALKEILDHPPAPPRFEHVISDLCIPYILAVAQIRGG
jgi:hypothetical protein